MNQLSLFDMNPGGNAGQNGTPGTASMTGGPLADRLRPAALEEYVGQRHLLGHLMLLHQDGRLFVILGCAPNGN